MELEHFLIPIPNSNQSIDFKLSETVIIPSNNFIRYDNSLTYTQSVQSIQLFMNTSPRKKANVSERNENQLPIDEKSEIIGEKREPSKKSMKKKKSILKINNILFNTEMEKSERKISGSSTQKVKLLSTERTKLKSSQRKSHIYNSMTKKKIQSVYEPRFTNFDSIETQEIGKKIISSKFFTKRRPTKTMYLFERKNQNRKIQKNKNDISKALQVISLKLNSKKCEASLNLKTKR